MRTPKRWQVTFLVLIHTNASIPVGWRSAIQFRSQGNKSSEILPEMLDVLAPRQKLQQIALLIDLSIRRSCNSPFNFFSEENHFVGTLLLWRDRAKALSIQCNGDADRSHSPVHCPPPFLVGDNSLPRHCLSQLQLTELPWERGERGGEE